MNKSAPQPLHPASAALGCACAAVGAWIAWNHPLSGPLGLVVFGALLVGSVIAPKALWWLVPAALPVIGLAPWTGWITFEEFDLLVLALAAGALLRPSRPSSSPEAVGGQRHQPLAGGLSALAALGVLLFAASALVAMWRGFGDAGGFAFGWFQGYHEPMNSLRLAKSFFLALLLWWVWRRTRSADAPLTADHLALGMTLGLVAVSVLAIWERAAYTGLLNFSSDYRTTALFWEMHVGGAALDGFLALTVPFALAWLLRADSRGRWMLAAAAMLLAAYVCLTTFSRGVYLATPMAIAVVVGLHLRQTRVALGPRQPIAVGPNHVLIPLAVVVIFTACAAWMFPTSGYRGMLALLGAFGLMVVLAPRLASLTRWHWLASLFGALVLGGVLWVLLHAWSKGAYAAYAAAAALAAVLVVVNWFARALDRSHRSMACACAVGSMLLVWCAMVWVALHWGGEPAAQRSLMPVLVLIAWLALASLRPAWPWPQQARGQLSLIGSLAVCAVVVGVFLGGSYMGQRFSTGSQDMQGRLQHWQIGMDALTAPLDWMLGKGHGRFPATHFNSGRTEDQTGDYRLREEGGNRYVVLSSGKHVLGWGEMFRFSQRVSPPAGASTVRVDVRATAPLVLHLEVCEKQLLYNDACVIRQVQVQPKNGAWQSLSVALEGERVPSRGYWVAPKLMMFSVSLFTQGSVVDLDNLHLTDASETPLLRNGGFEQDLASWFFTSDRHHMPWHIKSLFMHVLFDQGVVGLVLWLALTAGALWRLSLGPARSHALAPALAGALLGFAVVGLFDSLLDVPRIATLYYFLVLVALSIRRPQTATPA